MVITAVSSSISRTIALMSDFPASSDARNLRCPDTTSNLPSSAGRTRIGVITPPAMMLSMVSCISSSSSLTLNGWFLNGRSLSSGSSTTCSATSHSGFGSVRTCSRISCALLPVSLSWGAARAACSASGFFRRPVLPAVRFAGAAVSFSSANLHHLPEMTEAAAGKLRLRQDRLPYRGAPGRRSNSIWSAARCIGKPEGTA